MWTAPVADAMMPAMRWTWIGSLALAAVPLGAGIDAVHVPFKGTPALPDRPTALGRGVPDAGCNFRVGLFMPSGTPREIVERLYAETADNAALAKAAGNAIGSAQ